MVELILVCPQSQVESVSDALEALDAVSISIEDADANTPDEQAMFGEPGMPAPQDAWNRSQLQALFADATQAEQAVALLSQQSFFEGSAVLAIREVADQDWVRLTQSQFAPVHVHEDFWIVPSWHQAPASATTVIALDPGMAFGTGTHPTTRMCLRWTAKKAANGTGLTQLGRVLDYGCGSGILAIGAAKFGAQDIDAVDIDPAAVQATTDNAAANQVDLHAGLPELAKGPYQTVLANILATPLKVLAPLLTGLVQANGHLVLAGILERQEDELKLAYSPYCQLEVSDREDGWILMTAVVRH
jgi:ribosomal protein L11 methyltransferase